MSELTIEEYTAARLGLELREEDQQWVAVRLQRINDQLAAMFGKELVKVKAA